ncbi:MULTISPECIES: Crp/Fnr family transcriptional regulator [Listeria]|uniref:cyclic nucleotide-binding domain-containing protein n=1 Tax=Listeria TaxID=1637 RepID=UPI000B58ED4D|nr:MULTISPECIES: Crp/Fnr family transcriptional regulator [Listeria]
MNTLFSTNEFVRAIKVELPEAIKELEVPARTIVSFDEMDVCYIIISGIVEGYIKRTMETKSDQVYSFFTEGDIVGFGQIFDDFKGMIFETLTTTKVYAIKKEDLEYLLSFPHNAPFIYYIMKRLSSHYYLKSLLSIRSKENVLVQCMFNLSYLLDSNVESAHFVKLPKEYTHTRLMEYSTLSQGGFYKHLDLLYKDQIIFKDGANIVVDITKMRELHPATIPSYLK